MHLDSFVGTTHLLKKAVMVPTEQMNQQQKSGEQHQKRSISQPFTRGIMTFDDYNYKAFNELVLL